MVVDERDLVIVRAAVSAHPSPRQQLVGPVQLAPVRRVPGQVEQGRAVVAGRTDRIVEQGRSLRRVAAGLGQAGLEPGRRDEIDPFHGPGQVIGEGGER